MPFALYRNDALTEETAASDYEKWLNDDAGDAEVEAGSEEAYPSRNGQMKIPQANDRRSEVYG